MSKEHHHHKPERLQRHHKIWRCLGKVFPKSRELKAAINAPENIQMVTPKEHKELNADTPEVFNFLLEEFRGKRIRETVIPKEIVVFERKK